MTVLLEHTVQQNFEGVDVHKIHYSLETFVVVAIMYCTQQVIQGETFAIG